MSETNTERTLGRIEGKVDAMADMLSNDRERLNDHGKRLGSMERKFAAVWVFFAMMVSGSGAIAAKVFKGW